MMLISQDGAIAVNTDLVSSFRIVTAMYTVKAPSIYAFFPDGSAVKIGEFKDEKLARIVFDAIIHKTATVVKKVPKTIKKEFKTDRLAKRIGLEEMP